MGTNDSEDNSNQESDKSNSDRKLAAGDKKRGSKEAKSYEWAPWITGKYLEKSKANMDSRNETLDKILGSFDELIDVVTKAINKDSGTKD